MTSETPESWHFATWPALAWLETVVKLAALAIGITAGWQALATADFGLPQGWHLVAFVVLVLLSLGLLAAIADRWAGREIIAMIFVLTNNLGHWGMVARLATPAWPVRTLLLFAGLMLVGDAVKLVFIRVHHFTVRDYSSAKLIGLTSVYILGYSILILVELFG